ncbi:hypothetical protein HUJ05_005048 [Dendroctonus ponderosae]|nr:hypothetical protein HUJ05_005048 [Dendroctonus ponderosae]
MAAVSTVPFPPSQKLTVAEVFDAKTAKPKPEALKQHFVLEGRIDETAALRIINEGAQLLRAEKTMIDIEAPVTGAILFASKHFGSSKHRPPRLRRALERKDKAPFRSALLRSEDGPY